MPYQREFESRLKVAIVGVGSHAYRNILPAMTFLPVSLRAVCDIDPERVQSKLLRDYATKQGALGTIDVPSNLSSHR